MALRLPAEYARSLSFLVMLCLNFSASAQPQHRWQTLSAPTAHDLQKCFFLSTNVGWVAGKEGIILKTTNGGVSWVPQQSGVSTDIITIFMLTEERGWALTFTNWIDTATWWGASILQTRNGGETWTQEQFEPEGKYFHTIMFQDTLHGWMGGEFGDLLRTTDGGITWTPAIVDSLQFGTVAIVTIKFFTESTGFALGGLFDIAGIVRKTTDGGLRWIEYGVSPEPVYDIHRIDSLHLIGVSGDFEYGVGIIRSSDGGDSWTYEWLGIFGRPSTLQFRTPSEGWVATEIEPKFLFTSDTGRTWQEIPSPNGKILHDIGFVDSTTGYAVGDSGTILKYSTGSSGTTEYPGTNHPEALKLLQNYPNPFNATTQIGYWLGSASPVVLRIINPLGQVVQVLASGERKEAGYHSIQWDGRTMSRTPAGSGVYYCHIATPFAMQTKVMVLLK